MDHPSLPASTAPLRSTIRLPLVLDLSLGLARQMTADNNQASFADLTRLTQRVLRSLQAPDNMEQDVYLALQARAEQLDLDVAKGQDCTDGFEQTHAEVTRLLDVSPWTLHPDHGCVLTSEIERLDQAAQAPPRG